MSSKKAEKSLIYIGIDNGLTGGLVAVGFAGSLIDRVEMPTWNRKSGNKVDGQQVGDFLLKHQSSDEVRVIIETPGKFGAGVMAISSMWYSYGKICGVLEILRIRHHEITPQVWQKVMMPGCAKGDTKPAALAKARQLWPDERWLRSERCVKPHDGMIDAALIAEYGRIKNL